MSLVYLHRFRGEPAITRLGKPFTPFHPSSENFATFTGSVLQKPESSFNLEMESSPGFGSYILYFTRPYELYAHNERKNWMLAFVDKSIC